MCSVKRTYCARPRRSTANLWPLVIVDAGTYSIPHPPRPPPHLRTCACRGTQNLAITATKRRNLADISPILVVHLEKIIFVVVGHTGASDIMPNEQYIELRVKYTTGKVLITKIATIQAKFRLSLVLRLRQIYL